MTAFLRDFFHDLLRAYISPRALYTDIRDGRRSASWLLVLVYCLIYVVGTAWLASQHVQPFVEPFIKVAKEHYYLVQTFYEAPLVFALWVMAAGILHLIGRAFGGQGRYETILVMSGWSLYAPWMVLVPFDILAQENWFYLLVNVLLILLTVVGTAVAVKVEAGIKWGGAGLAALAAIVTMGLFFFVLIR